MKLMAHVFYDETGELIDIKLTVGFKRDESVWSRSCLHRQGAGAVRGLSTRHARHRFSRQPSVHGSVATAEPPRDLPR
jgi:hypothetical protein